MINIKLSDLLSNLTRRKKLMPEYTPKFKAGDWAHNKWKGFNTIIEIVKVVKRESLTSTLDDSGGYYELRTIYGDNKTSKSLYSRTKSIQAIDAYYTAMDKKTARILYGIE
jgi:hypothetical protein